MVSGDKGRLRVAEACPATTSQKRMNDNESPSAAVKG